MKTAKKFAAFLCIAVMLCLAVVVPASAAEERPFWLTHFDNNTVEGSGVVFTQPYDGAVWWVHVAFKPVEGANSTYEITAISDGTPDGAGVAQAIPEGGFVYASNYGNDYPALGLGDTDYTSDNCSNMIADILTWKVGDKFVIHGLDFENRTVPTTTPDMNWYDDEYVCTATYEIYDGSNAPADGTTDPVESSEDTPEPVESSEEAGSPAESSESDDAVNEPAESATAVSAPESAPAASESASEGLPTAAIVVIVVAAVAIICCVIILIVKKKK